MTSPGLPAVQTVDEYAGGHTGTRSQVGRHSQLAIGQAGVELGLGGVRGQRVGGQHPGGLGLRAQQRGTQEEEERGEK